MLQNIKLWNRWCINTYLSLKRGWKLLVVFHFSVVSQTAHRRILTKSVSSTDCKKNSVFIFQDGIWQTADEPVNVVSLKEYKKPTLPLLLVKHYFHMHYFFFKYWPTLRPNHRTENALSKVILKSLYYFIIALKLTSTLSVNDQLQYWGNFVKILVNLSRSQNSNQ